MRWFWQSGEYIDPRLAAELARLRRLDPIYRPRIEALFTALQVKAITDEEYAVAMTRLAKAFVADSGPSWLDKYASVSASEE